MSEQTYPTIVQTVIDTTDARRAAEFYRQLLGLAYRPGDEQPPAGESDPNGHDWLVPVSYTHLTLPTICSV